VQTNGAVDNFVLAGNTFRRVAYNLADNCRLGAENNDASQDTGGNIFECNAMINGGNSTGGSNGEGGVDYSRNIVRHNILDGGYIQMSPPEGGKPAQYINNMCNDCSIE
jgi:hypothetical protein